MNLTLNNICKKYGSHTVLEFDEWKINSGIYWLKGGNGTGKTTLFRIISGQTPFEGTVLLNEINLKKQPTNFRSKISYAEAEPQYPLFVTGKELLNFYAAIRKASQSDIDSLTDLFEMTAYLNQKIGDYSSGMLKKLSLICVFIGDVSLYILDEPLITIDTASADKLYRLIIEKSEQGKSFLISSHQEIDAAKLKVDGVFVIENKKVMIC
ncbi:ABC transporter ATP-binding protein [Pedobacter polaris]|uniref:ABC transporter ATP-binding protein n=1 Tax=Pedobacter polaris TaxID=2571273 RepID=A0A4U1CRN6_9SPHI|nr:ABC transporter ATP-binding protein [Pedobacter polaris]TKC10333.1 ABC transporter ATP-binding protein [Pedobacter polaris]